MTNVKLIPLSFAPFASIIETDDERLNERLSVETVPDPEPPEEEEEETLSEETEEGDINV